MNCPQRPCPLCDATNVRALHQQHLLQPEGSPLPSSYDVDLCKVCGFVYADTPRGQKDYDSYYARYSKYEDSAVATGGQHSEQDKKRFARLAERIAGKLSKRAKILDIGCANGGLLAALHERGFSRLHGLDGAADCVATVREMGIECHQSGLSTLDSVLSEQRFDLIVLSHVLEHLVDIKPVMQSAKKLLSPEGLVYIETPDASRYSPSDFVPFYFFDSEHINHFDGAHLGYLGQTIGLNAIETGTGELELNPDKRYPICWTWLSVQHCPGATPMGSSAELGKAVESYIATSASSSGHAVLEELGASATRVVIWGAGSLAQRVLGTQAATRCNIIGIVDTDRNKQGLSLSGHNVRPPAYLKEIDGEFVVLVAAAIAFDAIAAEARRILPTVRLLRLA